MEKGWLLASVPGDGGRDRISVSTRNKEKGRGLNSERGEGRTKRNGKNGRRREKNGRSGGARETKLVGVYTPWRELVKTPTRQRGQDRVSQYIAPSNEIAHKALFHIQIPMGALSVVQVRATNTA